MTIIELGARGLREASTLPNSGDVVLIDPRIYEDGPLVCKPTVIYRSADETGNERWRVEGCDGILPAHAARVLDVVLDGRGVADTGVSSDSSAPPSPAFYLKDYEIRNYRRAAVKQAHGQWANYQRSGNWRGTGDDWWQLSNGLHTNNGQQAGANGDSDVIQSGSDLHCHDVTWLDTGPDHAFYSEGRGLRLDRHCRFIRCNRALRLSCGNSIVHASFYDCDDPVIYVAKDVTRLSGEVRIGPGVELNGCGGDFLVYLDAAPCEGTTITPDLDFLIAGVTVRGAYGEARLTGIDFRDLTMKARRPVTLRAVDQNGADLIRPGFDPALVTFAA